MSEEERDWVEEEIALTVIYVRRGYSKEVAEGMARREITKRMVNYGYPIESEEGKDKEVGEKTKLKTVKTQKRRVTKE